MSTVRIGEREVPLPDAVALLLTEVHKLQTQNGELVRKTNEAATQHQAEMTAVKSQIARSHGVGFDVSVTIPKFTGSSKDNVHNFLMKVDQAATIGNWAAARTLLIAKQYLEGEALEWYRSDDTARSTESYDEFKKLLTDRFKKKTTPRFYREQLSNIKIKDNEDIEQFADRIRNINSHTYVLTDNAQQNISIKYEADQRALDAFLNGLTGELGQLTRQSRPQTFPEALASAVGYQESTKRFVDEARSNTRDVFATHASQGRTSHVRPPQGQNNWFTRYNTPTAPPSLFSTPIPRPTMFNPFRGQQRPGRYNFSSPRSRGVYYGHNPRQFYPQNNFPTQYRQPSTQAPRPGYMPRPPQPTYRPLPQQAQREREHYLQQLQYHPNSSGAPPLRSQNPNNRQRRSSH